MNIRVPVLTIMHFKDTKLDCQLLIHKMNIHNMTGTFLPHQYACRMQLNTFFTLWLHCATHSIKYVITP